MNYRALLENKGRYFFRFLLETQKYGKNNIVLFIN